MELLGLLQVLSELLYHFQAWGTGQRHASRAPLDIHTIAATIDADLRAVAPIPLLCSIWTVSYIDGRVVYHPDVDTMCFETPTSVSGLLINKARDPTHSGTAGR